MQIKLDAPLPRKMTTEMKDYPPCMQMEKVTEEKYLFSRIDTVVCIVLLVISACFFYYVNSAVKPINEWETLKYATPDSKTYLDVGKWLFDAADLNDVKSSVATRPFLYPLVIVILESIHPWFILIFQFILWQTQILMVYISCVKISDSRIIAFFVAVISISIISPVGVALHALTETVSSFFITFSVFVLTLNLYKKSYFHIFICLLSLSLCSVVRPSIWYIYMCYLSISITWSFKSKKILPIVIFTITAIPMLTQVHGMKKYFDTYTISFIDAVAINDYFLSGLELYKKNFEGDMNKNSYIRMIRDIRREHMVEMIDKEGYKKASKNIKKELFDNSTSYPFETFRQFKDLIIENSMQPSSFFTAKIFYIITLSQSKFLLTINIISILLFLIIFSVKIIKNIYIQNGYIMHSSFVLFIIYFTYISTGITFWQGDRFVIPIYHISIIFFIFQIKIFFESVSSLSICKQNEKN